MTLGLRHYILYEYLCNTTYLNTWFAVHPSSMLTPGCWAITYLYPISRHKNPIVPQVSAICLQMKSTFASLSVSSTNVWSNGSKMAFPFPLSLDIFVFTILIKHLASACTRGRKAGATDLKPAQWLPLPLPEIPCAPVRENPGLLVALSVVPTYGGFESLCLRQLVAKDDAAANQGRGPSHSASALTMLHNHEAKRLMSPRQIFLIALLPWQGCWRTLGTHFPLNANRRWGRSPMISRPSCCIWRVFPQNKSKYWW